MRLSWNEVRVRAAAFADSWQEAACEKGETQSFYNDFFQIFGVERRTVARYEAHVARLDNRRGFIDLFWPGVLIVEQKSAGHDLARAYEQAGDYVDALPENQRPRYILVSDFRTFELHDLDEGDITTFPLADLHAHVEKFGFILGVQRRTFRDQDPANIKAAELIGLLHDALADSGYQGHDLERFLVRVVLGLDRRANGRNEKRLFSYPDLNGDPEETRHATLSPYLFHAGGLSNPHLTMRETSAPVNGMGKLIIGSKPIDGGHYIFSAGERDTFLEAEPDAIPFLRPFVGAREYLQGGERWILALHDAAPDILARLPRVRERIAAVRAYRQASKSRPTQELAKTPTLYQVNVIPIAPFLVIPEVSSERREYVPIGWLEPPTIPSKLVRVLENAALADFALLTSTMHMAWLRHIGGRLKSDYRYSIGLVYNTFPAPPGFDTGSLDIPKLEALAQAVLNARAAHPTATLAELYDPDLMPPTLRRAHQALDRAVDRLYRPGGFASERQRVEHLFMLYEKTRTPLEAARQGKPKRRGRRR